MNRQRHCSKCNRELVNADGVHLGVPFGRWSGRGSSSDPLVSVLVCAGCYDAVTVDLDTKVAKSDA